MLKNQILFGLFFGLITVIVLYSISFESVYAKETNEFEEQFRELERNYERSISEHTQNYEEQKRQLYEQLKASNESDVEIGKKLGSLYESFNQKSFQLKAEYLKRLDALEQKYGQKWTDIASNPYDDSEIQSTSDEQNSNLDEIVKLNQRINELEQQNRELMDRIASLEKSLQDANTIVMEQVKIIYEWVIHQK